MGLRTLNLEGMKLSLLFVSKLMRTWQCSPSGCQMAEGHIWLIFCATCHYKKLKLQRHKEDAKVDKKSGFEIVPEKFRFHPSSVT